MSQPTVTITRGPPVFNLDKLREEREQIKNDLVDLDRTYNDAKRRMLLRLDENQFNIDRSHDILAAHQKAAS